MATAAAIVLGPLLSIARRWSSPSARGHYAFVSGLAILQLASVMYTGGDCYWGGGRFFACSSVLSMLALALAGCEMRGALRVVPLVVLGVLAVGSVRAGTSGMRRTLAVVRSWPVDDVNRPNAVCDVDEAAALASLDLRRFAQTDYQRLEYVADGFDVIDASGLNDVHDAHVPSSLPVRFGKGGVAHALRRGAEALSYGYRFPFTPEPMASASGFEFVNVEAVRDRYMGVSLDPLYANAVDDELHYASFVPASVRACGRWFNFWVHNDRADRLRTSPSLKVGAREPPFVVTFDASGKKVTWVRNAPSPRVDASALDGRAEAAEVDVEPSAGRTVVRFRRLPTFASLFRTCSVGGVTSGPPDVTATWDGIPLARWLDSPRHVLHVELLDPSKEHRLIVGPRDEGASAPLVRVFVDCEHRPPWEPE